MRTKLLNLGDTLLPALMLVGVCLEVHYEAEVFCVIITAVSFVGYLKEWIKNRKE